MHHGHTHFLVLCLPFDLCDLLPQKKKKLKKELKKRQVQFVLSVYSLEHDQTLNGPPFK